MARLTVLAACCALLLAPAAARAGDAEQTGRALARAMARAGPTAGALAVELDSGRVLFASQPDVERIPASVNKLFTTVAALRRFGPAGTLVTRVLGPAPLDPAGVLGGNLWLRGEGDPTFGREPALALAEQLVAEGLVEIGGRVIGDETAFDARRGPPSEGFVTSPWVGPLSALGFEHGRTGARSPYFQQKPALFAAQAFDRALRRLGVSVARRPRAGAAPPLTAELGAWPSPPASELIRRANVPSDNYIAEMLLKALGGRFGAAGTTAAGASVAREALAEVGVEPTLVDGSGLSRLNRATPRDVVALLEAFGDDPAFTGSLAVAGRTGTLRDRMRSSPARDRCSAKTGTLRFVSALAGYCTSLAGRRTAFAVLIDRTWIPGARAVQDRVAAALARYR